MLNLHNLLFHFSIKVKYNYKFTFLFFFNLLIPSQFKTSARPKNGVNGSRKLWGTNLERQGWHANE